MHTALTNETVESWVGCGLGLVPSRLLPESAQPSAQLTDSHKDPAGSPRWLLARKCVDAILAIDGYNGSAATPQDTAIAEGAPSMPTVFVDDALTLGEPVLAAAEKNISRAFYQGQDILGVKINVDATGTKTAAMLVPGPEATRTT